MPTRERQPAKTTATRKSATTKTPAPTRKATKPIRSEAANHRATTQLISRAYRLDRSLFELVAADFGISAAQYGLLHRIQESPGLAGSDLAKVMWVTPQAVQGLLSQLEEEGLIKRVRQRGRALRAELTPAGHDLLKACAPAVQKFQSSMVAVFNERQRNELNARLEQYVSSAEAALAARQES